MRSCSYADHAVPIELCKDSVSLRAASKLVSDLARVLLRPGLTTIGFHVLSNISHAALSGVVHTGVCGVCGNVTDALPHFAVRLGGWAHRLKKVLRPARAEALMSTLQPGCRQQQHASSAARYAESCAGRGPLSIDEAHQPGTVRAGPGQGSSVHSRYVECMG